MVLRESTATFGRGGSFKLAFVGLIYLDLMLTLLALQLGFTEMNPFMLRLITRPEQLLLVKVVLPPLIAWLVPARLLLPAIIVLLAVSGWNIRELLVSF